MNSMCCRCTGARPQKGSAERGPPVECRRALNTVGVGHVRARERSICTDLCRLQQRQSEADGPAHAAGADRLLERRCALVGGARHRGGRVHASHLRME